MKRFLKVWGNRSNLFWKLLGEFFHALFVYSKSRLSLAGHFFERHKNIFVRFLLMKRGRYNRPFLHLSAMSVMAVGVVIGPFLADTYPVFSSTPSLLEQVGRLEEQSIAVDEDVFQTHVSQRPRDTIITYTVEKGDTLSTIAKKFDISVDTIKWVNNLTSDSLTVGDELKILPVSGVSHKVARGETVYSIAKKYDTEPQKIADFPFNEWRDPEGLTLIEGQMLIVPDGVPPRLRPSVPRRPTFIAQGPTYVSGAGFSWPVSGAISQGPVWYHMAVDIISPIGTPIIAARSGTVVKALTGVWDGGYGTNLMVDDGTFQSLYSHLSGFNVSVGDEVVAGKTVLGWVGMTGRTTGPHLHFEIRKNGALVNPLPYLQ